MSEQESALTFEKFVEEASEKVRKHRSLHGAIIFSENDAWLNIDRTISRYNLDAKLWDAALLNTNQDDFFILRFRKRVDQNEEKFFFIKALFDEENYITLYVFSYEGHTSFRLLESLVSKSKYIGFGWVGSLFLESFDEFIKDIYPDSSTILVKFVLDKFDMKSKKRIGSSINYETRTTNELLKERKSYYSNFNEMLYVKKGKYRINIGKTRFTLSLSDKTEFILQGGQLIDFLELLKYILLYARERRDRFTKKVLINKFERKIGTTNETREIFSIDHIEQIKIDVNSPIIPTWHDEFVETFSLDYLQDDKILSFVLQQGNPYFLAEVIDLENHSRVYLSLIGDSIRISPSTEPTNPKTISKLFSILQSRVDPSISPT